MATYPEWIETPRIAQPDQPQNGTKVVAKDAAPEPCAVDQSCGLEELFVLVQAFFGACWLGGGDGGRVDVVSALVELQEFVSNVLREVEKSSALYTEKWIK